MIYSENFVWLHFPRCAGTKIEQLFRKYYSHDKRISQDIVDPKLDQFISWHDSIAEREARDRAFSLADRVVICSFRQLPAWLESRYNFEHNRSPHLNHQPEQLLDGKFLEQDGGVSQADWYAKKYLPEAILYLGKVRFIRTEYFEFDFKLVFREFLDVSRIPDWEFSDKVNVSSSALPIDIRKRIFDGQGVYANCPYWKIVEDVAYG
jgi:hypothetical protein